ncbi:hypothetical protein GCM10010124_25900 [Pilimelia terevasa]|uniref:Uncharacterized protein n=1 Tax=Pilimelia terevasa TaxID=53372 RepID=A0A8J3BNI3_9ACTN|nr:hypothetical protein [Pilimelia terevasa]GGK31946.1 hypothetical protein GCM10010124_25900 [Pilimelia terevasa]
MVTPEDHAARVERAHRGAALCRAALQPRPEPEPARPLTRSEQIHARALERARTDREARR